MRRFQTFQTFQLYKRFKKFQRFKRFRELEVRGWRFEVISRKVAKRFMQRSPSVLCFIINAFSSLRLCVKNYTSIKAPQRFAD